jgi:EAL domain-containing protein (putative c-di-GMP-specific phosphodiesterase class I)
LENLIKDVLLHTAEGLGLSFYGAFDIYPVHTESPEQLKHHVLNMLHQYSLENESRFVPFDAKKYLDFLRKEQIREGLHSKTLSDELRTVFQPKLTSDGVVCIGFEALVRWDSLGLGMVSPAEFIPLAENTNAIRVITNRVFRDCVSMAENLLAAGATVFRISFNMSPVLLIAEYLEDLIKNIQQSGLAQYFEIEITEGILMKSEQFVSDHFNRLNELGVQFSIDDFGTGYSNLSYLQNFAAEVLKIDMQFIKDLPGSEKNANLVNAIINMAKSFNMKTIAEGVETNAQACLLQESGCTYIQGYFYAKPLDAAEALAFLLEHRDLNGRSKNQCT